MWIAHRNHKNLKHRRRNRKGQSYSRAAKPNNYIKKAQAPTRKNDIETITVTAPQNFSIINNADELSKFFEEITYYLKNHKKNKVVVNFNLGPIEQVTIDAIMYLLAIIKNLQLNDLTRHKFEGNLPKNEPALSKFKESGFLNFVNSNVKKVTANENKIAIRTGQSNDGNILKEICDFVIERAKCTKAETKFLYPLMAEMMYNTHEHAYGNKSITMKNWYIFVECEDNLIKTTFLDTGLGIPSTIKKRLGESLFKEREDKLLESALNGEFRSKTKLTYRNTGLPTIKDHAMKREILNLHIVSNKAYCYINEDNSVVRQEIESKVAGTIFYWEVDINNLRSRNYEENFN